MLEKEWSGESAQDLYARGYRQLSRKYRKVYLDGVAKEGPQRWPVRFLITDVPESIMAELRALCS